VDSVDSVDCGLWTVDCGVTVCIVDYCHCGLFGTSTVCTTALYCIALLSVLYCFVPESECVL
jgi:hypothetical protein